MEESTENKSNDKDQKPDKENMQSAENYDDPESEIGNVKDLNEKNEEPTTDNKSRSEEESASESISYDENKHHENVITSSSKEGKNYSLEKGPTANKNLPSEEKDDAKGKKDVKETFKMPWEKKSHLVHDDSHAGRRALRKAVPAVTDDRGEVDSLPGFFNFEKFVF